MCSGEHCGNLHKASLAAYLRSNKDAQTSEYLAFIPPFIKKSPKSWTLTSDCGHRGQPSPGHFNTSKIWISQLFESPRTHV